MVLALRFDVVSVPSEQSLTDYLTSGWIDNIEKKSVDETTINGFPTATATAKGDQWAFRLYVVRFGSEVYRFIFATKRMTAEADKGFRESVQSFRRMSLAESKAARPLRLHAVEAAVAGKPQNEETASMAAELAIQGNEPLAHNGYKIPLMRNLVKRSLRAEA